MIHSQQQNEIIGDLTVKLALTHRNKEQFKETLENFTKSVGEDIFENAVDYLKASDNFGFSVFKNRAKEIDSKFGFYEDNLKHQYKNMVLKGDYENMDDYINYLIPF